MDLEALSPSPECPADHVQRLKLAVPEVRLMSLLEIFHIMFFMTVQGALVHSVLQVCPFIPLLSSGNADLA